MKITALKVNGFGVWSGLTLDDLSDELNVFCGPNEAGKTTLLQFVRAVLYGFSPERMRYLPPLRGGRPGGLVDLDSQQGTFQVERHNDHTDKNGRAPAVLTAADGTRQPEPLLNQVLCNVDEAVFSNVFAFGLQEIQQLGSLGDTEAAELLFSLTTGLDRVSLVEVMRELEASRNRLLGADGNSGQIVQLLADRNRIKHEIEDLGSLTASYGRLATQRNHLDRDLGRLEEEQLRLRHDTRSVEIAVSNRSRWEARIDVEARLAGLRQFGTIPEGAVARLERIDAAVAKNRNKLARLADRRRRLRSEARSIQINDELCRRTARVEALYEQKNWLGTLENRTAELKLESEQIRAELAAEYESLGLTSVKQSSDTREAALPQLGRRQLRRLRGPMAEVRRYHHELEDTQKEIATATDAAQEASRQIATSLGTTEQADLSTAINGAGNLVSQFRRRVQLDERIEQMEQYQAELGSQIRGLLEGQVMPAWMPISLGAAFVCGAIMVVTGFFWPGLFGGFGWLAVTLGIVGLAAGVGAKFYFERSNANRLESCQKQLSMIRVQIKEAVADRDALDELMPAGIKPSQGRLENAQSELAALEELMPIEARRQSAQQEADAALGRATRIEEELSRARRRWREALQSAGLPENLSPKQVRLLSRRCDHLEELSGRLERCREELHHRGEELRGITGRIYQLASDTGVSASGDQPARLLDRLFEQLNHQQALLNRRQTLRDQSRGLQRVRTKREKVIRRLRRRRRELFQQAGAADEHDFREKASRREKAETLNRELEALRAEIEATVGGHCPQSEIAELLDNYSSETLEKRWDENTKRLEEIEVQIRERFEQRGKLTEKLKVLADDRRPAERQLELSIVKQRLKESIRRWRVLALTNGILQNIRIAYEKDRQPATLQEASGYLRRLTEGRYTRVWTPLGEDVLRVDDAAGESLPCEVLSRGTREQLFLSLRLALVSSYARRGAKLPLILDDVLVNFDTKRARAAANVLADFARAGHQLLVFTCHDHILKLFRSLNVRVSRLPDNSMPGEIHDEVEFIEDDLPVEELPEEIPDEDQQEAAEAEKPAKKPKQPKASKKSKHKKGRNLKRAQARRAMAEAEVQSEEDESHDESVVDDEEPQTEHDPSFETTVFEEAEEEENHELGGLEELMNNEEAFEWELASDEPDEEDVLDEDVVDGELDDEEEYEYEEYEEEEELEDEDDLYDAA
ncbi:MAG: AAA family ATPase [Pirellulales bacterium]|nr:AAA family ATPase [Pirellulales bacterium]